eukprot:TRINITY_DN5165_c0_g1_i1.p3 TRINITY_DN5165_c0_g1~~TRINITY_DN5165_c0_g1_i1.p3  ORF type:complete len:100 (-),score=29.83 TRINITY_DN5165_c0_g1_i1:129-428(-)
MIDQRALEMSCSSRLRFIVHQDHDFLLLVLFCQLCFFDGRMEEDFVLDFILFPNALSFLPDDVLDFIIFFVHEKENNLLLLGRTRNSLFLELLLLVNPF